MQYDMHYYGTYAMAAAAGIPKGDAEIIAYASQYVDDQDHTTLESVRQVADSICEAVVGIATAHNPIDAGLLAKVGLLGTQLYRKNTKTLTDDSRLVWVPFHFIPGNKGKTFLEKIVCQKDSPIANEMIDNHIKLAGEEAYGPHLMGIAAHVYADTFAHYGFSGVSSELNSVDVSSIKVSDSHRKETRDYLEGRSTVFQDFFGIPYEHLENSVHLGHGGVDTHPDRPFLIWEFRYSSGKTERRSNPDTFVEACRKLYDHFIRFAQIRYANNQSNTSIPFANIEGTVRSIIEYEGKGDDRVEQWMNAMENGLIGCIKPCVRYDHTAWTVDIDNALKERNATKIKNSNAFHFHAAAEFHRHYVLKLLLPKHELIIA
jgi:hypothetical protein